jgi:hypothetical protein
MAQHKKVFLLLFVHKKKVFPFAYPWLFHRNAISAPTAPTAEDP